MKFLIFSDIDGTFTNFKTYSSGSLDKYLKNLNLDYELIFNSSKTYEEIVKFKKKFKLNFPFIAENGACIFFPQDYLKKNIKIRKFIKYKKHHIFKLTKLRANRIVDLLSIFKKKYNFKFYNELSNKELQKITKLTIENVKLSKLRQFSNPIYWDDSVGKKKKFIKDLTLIYSDFAFLDGGRFIHVLDKYNKGLAVKKFLEIINMPEQGFKTISLGDSQNDIPMLEQTNFACIIKSKKNVRLLLKNRNLYRSNATAPDGWQESLDYILRKGIKNF